MSAKKLLIIAYYFPPYDKVGGRRWAKHYKYLLRMNVDATVLTCKFDGVSPWDNDLLGLEDHIVRLYRKTEPLPYYLTSLPANFFQKIRWKFSKWSHPKKESNTYHDLSSNMYEAFSAKALELVQQKKITDVILSGGPFHYSKTLIDIKNKFSGVRTILDYRDHWEDFFSGMNAKQIEHGEQLQEAVIKNVDMILVPNEEMAKHYKERFGKSTYLLPHCFDEDDMKKVGAAVTNEKEIILVYGGAFYANLSNELNRVRKVLENITNTVPCKADFFVSLKGYEKELTHPSISRSGFIPSDEYFNKVVSSDYSLLVLPPNRINAMSSKFFELIALRKPILYFGDKGTVSEFITKNELGFCFTNDEIDRTAAKVIDSWKTKKGSYKNFDISGYTFLKQTEQLLEKLT